MTMLISIMLTLSFIMLWLNHPISMGITIISLTITVAVTVGLLMGSFWYSFIIMITMLSGMLVLFIYMASVASNEKFSTPVKLIIMSISFMLLGVLMFFMYDNYYNEMNTTPTIMSTENISLNMLFNIKFKFLTMMMVLYLFFAMVTISFIVNISEGPLRINKK
uniref:NADH dehydrogenase subunit 6 n=1 Tax=Melanacanthus marginatus TaxID=2924067 RepID=UPI001FA7D409|nr:NADH dehydrogenase subunit 6 [Melanacanthus marginatus]UMY75932.1 NADH dehydrogenase subunit 6 [Melanacanthus marginatus]